MRSALRLSLAAGALWFAVQAPAAHAQMGGGMPDLRAMSGKPLPTPELPVGTVSVRVSRQIPVNGVAGANVAATIVKDGKTDKQEAKTGEDGRATFKELSPGTKFQAETTVDGERLVTAEITIPAQGGTRVLLIAGLAGAAPSGTADQEPAEAFSMGAVNGSVQPDETLPPGTLVLNLLDEAGKPIPLRKVQIGRVGNDNSMQVHRGESDQAGVARFSDLPVGEAFGYAAVIVQDKMRIGTEPFRMASDKGMRGTIRALSRTADSSVLRLDARSKIILDVREDAVAVMQNLVFKNLSEMIFDATGSGGLLVPFPKGATGAQEIPGGAPLEIRQEALAVRQAIPPNQGDAFGTQVRFGFVVPAKGSADVSFTQPLPFGMEAPLILIPAAASLTLSAPGLRALPDNQDAQGNVVKVYELPAIAPGGTLALTVSGLPARKHTGRTVATALCVLLLAVAVWGARRSGSAHRKRRGPERDGLIDARERLFAQLVEIEQQRKTASQDPPQSLDEKRREIVTKLETIYRDLAEVEEGKQGAQRPPA